jgi:DNA-binding response OmpR family regulator
MKKICIVEDEKNIAEMYRVLFKQEGYEVRCAYDGEEGLKMIKEFKPDLVLLDLMLPKINGFDVLKKLKCQRLNDRMVVCVLSNLDQRDDMEKVFELGANHYFVKSHITPRKLMDRLYRITAFAN